MNVDVNEIVSSVPIVDDWRAIQERNIDPLSPVNSDNHNKLLKILGNHKAFIKGFSISVGRDEPNNQVLFNIQPGVGVITYVVLDIKTDVNLIGFTFPEEAKSYKIVLEYKYLKTTPPPMCTLKVINEFDFDANIHLPLYSFKTDTWYTIPSLEDLQKWFSEHMIDERTSEGNTPEWVYDRFVKKTGDTVTGMLVLKDGIFENPKEAINKEYVDKLKDYFDEMLRKSSVSNSRMDTLENNQAEILLALEKNLIYPDYSNWIIEDFLNTSQIDTTDIPINSIMASKKILVTEPSIDADMGITYLISDTVNFEYVQVVGVSKTDTETKIYLDKALTLNYDPERIHLYRTTAKIENGYVTNPTETSSKKWSPNYIWTGETSGSTIKIMLQTYTSDGIKYNTTNNVFLTSDGRITINNN